jgi:hypothetical protein
MDDIANKIIDFYKDKTPLIKKPINFEIKGLINYNPGLGDALSVTSISKVAAKQNKEIAINSPSPHFPALCKFNPYYKPIHNHVPLIRAEFIQGYYEAGNGHFFQWLQRACCLEPDLKPKATIIYEKPKIKNRIILHLSVGVHATVQKQTIHPRAREFYPEHKETLQKFILDNKDKYEFIEIGTNFSGLNNVQNKCGLKLEESIHEMAQGEYFLGLHSGVMHVAAALDLKSIIIINFPRANNLYLPYLKDIGLADMNWLYPQNVHLHEDDKGELVPMFSYENIEKALDGAIYPYWKDNYLNLIHEI